MNLLTFTEEEDKQEKGRLIYRLHENGKVVCTAVLLGRGNLEDIHSDPKGRGFGTKMLEYVKRKALENELSNVSVSAIADDDRVRHFFEKNGYELTPDPQCSGESKGKKTLGE